MWQMENLSPCQCHDGVIATKMRAIARLSVTASATGHNAMTYWCIKATFTLQVHKTYIRVSA